MPASTTFTWTGATSTNWNDATNWAINGVTASVVPGAGDNITIPAAAANQPAIPNGQSGTLVGLVDNDGTISVNGAQFGTQLDIAATGATTVTLQSDKGFTGVILLSNSGNNTLQGGVAGASLENVNNIIEGGGSIEAGAGLSFQNDAAGVIDGDDSTTLTIGVNITNKGLIEATGSGGVLINNGAVINQSGGGALEANGGNVSLSGATIEGGALTTTGSSEIVAGAGTNLLDGLTGGAVTISKNSTVAVSNGNALYLQGAIVNDGTFAVNGAQFGTQLDIGSGSHTSVTLSGGGVVSLADSGNSHIQGGAATGATLTNVNDTIEGGGSIQAGPSGLAVVNQGVIDATVGTTLSVSVSVTNEGTLEATAGTGGLSLSATIDNTDAGANNLGKIIAGAVGEANALQVALNGATIIGGTLTTVNPGDSIVAASGTDLLDGSTPNDPLTIALASTVAIANSHALSLAGSIVNKGTISSNAAQFGTDLDIGAASSASVTLSGGGVVSLSNSSNNVIQGNLATASLTNIGDTIEGAGTIQAGAGLKFVNDSTVNANQTTGLTITVSVSNNALIEATNSGGLLITNAAVINQSGGGTLEANGGNVTLSSATIEGGTLTSTGSSAILAGSGTNLLDGVTGGAVTISNNSTVGVNNGDSLYLQGSIINDGTLALYAAQFGTNLDIGSGTNTSVTLSGGGVVSLSNSANNNILGGAATLATLTNVNNTIEGGGTIQGGVHGLTVVNQSAINANAAATLSISAPVANSGTLESTTGTGGLSLSATIDNTSGGKNNLGQIIAGSTTEANAAQVVLNGATIIGGTLTTVNPGDLIVVASGTDLLDGSTTGGASTISKGSTVQINNSQNLSVAGSIVNKGTISVDGAQFGTNLDIGSASSASVTLSGGGVVSMSNSGANSIQGNLATSALTNVDNTIEGAGTIQAGTGLAFTNDGTINANQSNALTISINVTNKGTIEATGGGGLTINNGALINQSGGGTLEANGGNVSLSGATIEGGTLTTLGTSAVLATGGTNLLDGKTGGAVTISTNSAVQINNSQNLALAGSIVNKGTISLNGAQFGTDLEIGSGSTASVTLSGGGVVSLSNSVNNNILDGTGAAATLTNEDNTIEGAGAIQSGAGLTVVNDGVINANLTTGLVINAAITNNANIESTNTGGITLNGGVVINQSGGGSIQGQAGTVALSNATIVGGTLTTTAGIIAATGGTDLLDGKTGGALKISSGSNVQVTNSNSLSLDGVINNDGTITVNGAQFGTQLNIGATGATSVTLQSDKGSSGVVILSNSVNNHLQGGVAGASLENVNNTIEGGGSIQSGAGLFFQNDAAGVIDADDAATLTVSANITNNGLIEATGAGGLLINSSAVINQSGGGTLEANGGNVSLSNAMLEGGTLTSTGSNQIIASGGTNVLDGVTGGALTISKGSTVAVANSDSLFLQGAIVNDGTLAVNGAQFGTFLEIGSGANTSVTLSGGGVVSLSNSGNNFIQGGAATPSTLTNVNDTIEGGGSIQGGAGLTVLNSGVIDATDSTNLNVTTALTNQASGILRAEQGARLNIQNALTNIAADPNHSGGNVLTGGTYDVVDAASGASTIAITGGSGGITTLAAAVNLAGASSTLMDNGTTLAQSLVEVAAGGALNLTFGVNSATQQNFSDGSAVTIDKGGSVNVSGAAFATGGLTISLGGQLRLTGAFAGTKAESATVAGNIVNSGSIVVAGVTPGAVQPSSVLESAITGTGAIAVNQDALADFEAGVGVGQTITFGDNQVLGGGGVAGVETVQIQSSSLTTTGVGASDFSATLAGFKVGDAIDLAHFSGETNYSFNGATLTVNFTNGGAAQLTLSGVGAKTGFHFGSDGAAGTLITTGTSLLLAHDTGVSATDGLTNNPALTGTSDAGATLTFTEGGKTLGTTLVNADGTFNFTPAGLSDGTQTITASEGGAGSGTESASVTFTLATTAPGVTGAGLSGLTNKTSDTITGVVTPEALAGNGVASVQIVDASNNVVATATLGANGGYSATVSGLADGAHDFAVVATDDAGNVAKLALAELDVATAAPTVSASESVSGATTQTSDTITVTAASEAIANDKIASVVVKDGSATLGSATLTSGSATSGTYSFTASNLNLGAHNFSVVTTDAAGNSATSTLASVTVQPSNGPTVTNLTETPSGLTKSNTVTISETATPAQGATVASVQVLDGGTPIGSATLNASTGVWSFTTGTLADGPHSLSTVTTDNFGLQTTTAFPAVDIATQAPVNSSASESVSGITNKTSDAVSVTPTVENVPGNGVKSVNIVDTKANSTTAATLGTGGVYSATLSGLAEGAHTLEIVTTDLAGNQTTTPLAALDVATKAPVNGSPTQSVSGITNKTSDTISVTPTVDNQPGNGVKSVNIVDTTTNSTTAATLGTGGVYSATLSGLAEGAHTLEIVTTDLAGNQTTTPLAALDVATKAPVVSASETVSGATTATSDTISETATAESVPNNGIASVVVSDGATKLGAATLANGVWSFTVSNLSEGTHNFSTLTTDLAGNSTTTTLTPVTVNPSQPPTVSASQTLSGLTNLTFDTIAETATAASGLTIASVEVFDGKTDLGAATFSSTTNLWSFTASGLADGPHDFTTVTTDSSGQKTTTALAEFDVATKAPTVTASESVSGLTNKTADTITEAATAEAVGANAIASVQVYDGAKLLGSATLSGGKYSFTTAKLTDGPHDFNTVTTDAAGNVTKTALAEVDVATKPPTVTASESASGLTTQRNITVSETATAEAVGSNAIASVKVYDGATLLGSATLTGGKYSFTTATLAYGVHNLSTLTTDAAGNSTTTTLAAANVEPPPPKVTIALADDTSNGLKITNNDTVTGSGDANALVHFTIDGVASAQTATANASGVWTFTPASLPQGANTIEASETNGGDAGTATLAFTYDTIPPTVAIATPAATVAFPTETIDGSGEVGSTVQLFDGTQALGGPLTVGSNGLWSEAVTLSDAGAHAITATATDAANNVGASKAVSLFLDNQITGQPGQFALIGTSGSDHIVVGANNSLVMTLGGNDTVSLTSAGGASQFHVIIGGGGSDTLDLSGTGGGAAVDLSQDTAVGSQIGTNLVFNFNNIIGGGGAETLKLKSAGGSVQAGSGADVITGGAASDTFAFLSSFGVDTITNFQVAGATHDVFAVSQNLFANWQTLDAALSDTAGGARLSLNATESVTFTGVTKAGLEANNAADFRFV